MRAGCGEARKFPIAVLWISFRVGKFRACSKEAI